MDFQKDSAGPIDNADRPELLKNPSVEDIGALTQAMKQGDEGAYRQFYDVYYSRLLRYQVVVCAGREETAREALQTTFLRIVRHVRRFDSEAVFWSWMTVLARSAAKDELRKQQRHGSFLDRFFRTRDQEPPNVEADSRLAALLEKQLDQLPESDRALIVEKYLNGQAVKSIALQAQASEKAIDSRLVRIRKKLKAAILAELKDEQFD